MTARNERLTDLRWVGVFVALGLATRLLGPVDRGLWFDEIWTLVDFIRLPLAKLLVTYGSDNNHPLYSILAWFSVHGLGESALSLRLPALLFGAGSLGMLYWLAKDVTERSEALLATGLLLLSYHHVWFSQNARGYTILLFCTLGATHFFLRNLAPASGREDGSSGRPAVTIALQGLMLALGTFAHASAVFVAIGQLLAYAAWLVKTRGAQGRPGRLYPLYGLVAGGALSLLMHLGILGDLIAYFTQSDAAAAAPVEGADNEWKSPWWTLKATAESLGLGLWPGLFALVGGASVLAVGALSYLRRTPIVTLAFVLPALGSALMLLLGRPLRPRFLFFEAGFVLLFVVRGMFVTSDAVATLAGPQRRARVATWLRRAAAAAALAAFLVILPRAYLLPKQDFEGAMAYAQGLAGPDTAVMTVGLAVMPYQQYYRADFVPVQSRADFEAAIRGKQHAYVLNTISVYLQAFKPELAALLAERGTEVRRFAGSMGDGDIIVYEVRL